MNLLDRRNDSRIRAATADISAHALTNFVGGQISGADFSQIGGDVTGVAPPGFLQKRDGGANLSRCAVAALESVMLQERRLHWMQLIALRQAFNGGDLLAFMRHGQRETAIDAAAIGQNGARATLPVIAPFFCAGELEPFTQKIQQRGARVERKLLLLSIDGELQRDSAAIGSRLLDFCDCDAASMDGKAHDRASGKKAGRGNKLPAADGPAIDRRLRLCIFIYSLGIFSPGLRGFVIHLASSRRESATDSNEI